MIPKTVETLIVGAGPTGLGAGYRLKELGETNFLILDSSDRSGGLATSFTDDKGFTWDIGGHVQFSHYKYFDDLMVLALGKEGWLHHQRESWAWMHGKFVPYPVQNNIRYLPKEIMWKCLEGFIEANVSPQSRPPLNFKEWIFATFGNGFAETFMLPYNFKVWAYPPEHMGHGWVGERVAIVDLKRATQNILFEKDDLSWGPNNTFQFPKKGGTGSIWKAVAALIGEEKIFLHKTVTRIDVKNKTAHLASGELISYKKILSTMPVDLLCGLITPSLSADILTLVKSLKHSSSNIVGIGLKGKIPEPLKTKCWMYFPEEDCPFYRATVFSNYSPNNVPDSSQFWSLMCEVSESPFKPVHRNKLLEDTLEGCLKTGLIKSKNDVVSTWVYSADYGYPTPSLERDSILNQILPLLESYQISSRGRFGAWKYEVSNQDHSLMQGVEWVNWKHLGIPEITVNFPNTANANWGKR